MKRENDEITDLFRSRLGHAEMTVREGFWEELNEDVAACCQQRRRVLFFRVVAAASVLLVLAASSAAFWFFSPKEEMEEAFTQLAVSGVGTLDGDRANQSFSPSRTEPVLHKPTPGKMAVLSHADEEDDDSVSVTLSVSFSFSATATNNGYVRDRNAGDNIWKTSSGNDDIAPVAVEKEPDMASVVSKVEKKRTWAVKTTVGTALPAEKRKYKMPVMTGVTIEKRLGEYLGIETGLAYSNLRANGQGLHYLGIPVKMNVYLADLKKFDLYASIGAVADKCIAGAPSNNFKNEPVQLAVTAGVGVSYKVNDRIALFAEPGVSHHFDTDSRIETIRTKRPTNFNLLCGLRMTY